MATATTAALTEEQALYQESLIPKLAAEGTHRAFLKAQHASHIVTRKIGDDIVAVQDGKAVRHIQRRSGLELERP